MGIWKAAFVTLPLLLACGTDHAITTADAADSDLLPSLAAILPKELPTNGMRFITPPTLGLEPGSSHEICAWTGVKVDQTTDIRIAKGYQGAVGHHIILFSSKDTQPAGTQRECTDVDMASFRMVAATGMEGIPSEAPGDLVYRIEAGSYIALQEHYLNEGDTTVDSQSALDIFFADPTMTYTPSHSIALLNTNLDLKPGPNTLNVHCELEHDMTIWYGIPHMHEWGTMYNATITHAGVTTPLVDHLPWTKDYVFSPPQIPGTTFATPRTLSTGDAVDIQCNWNNTTTSDLHFGAEMCVFYASTIDSSGMGNMDCDNGDWGSF